jgi:hypothetical protein
MPAIIRPGAVLHNSRCRWRQCITWAHSFTRAKLAVDRPNQGLIIVAPGGTVYDMALGSLLLIHVLVCCRFAGYLFSADAGGDILPLFGCTHRMGKESRTPSVEARVVETKHKLSRSWEKFFLLCLDFLYSVSISFIFFHHLFFYVLLPRFTDIYSFRVRLFWPEGDTSY